MHYIRFNCGKHFAKIARKKRLISGKVRIFNGLIFVLAYVPHPPPRTPLIIFIRLRSCVLFFLCCFVSVSVAFVFLFLRFFFFFVTCQFAVKVKCAERRRLEKRAGLCGVTRGWWAVWEWWAADGKRATASLNGKKNWVECTRAIYL